jgi:hypothetical protein
VTVQTFNVGDLVHADGANTNARVTRTKGEGDKRLYWIEIPPPVHTYDPSDATPRSPSPDGIANPSGPYTADRLKPAR